MLDHCACRPMVWDVYVQRVVIPGSGGQADEMLISAALPAIETVLRQLVEWRDSGPFLVGDSITLADFDACPMLRHFVETGEGAAMPASLPGLEAWMRQMQSRPSAAATSFHSAGASENGF